jgi:hypothetical protein
MIRDEATAGARLRRDPLACRAAEGEGDEVERYLIVLCAYVGALGEELVDGAEPAVLRRNVERRSAILQRRR